LRAPTPTAAAELACAPRRHWLDRVSDAAQRIARTQTRRLASAAQKLDSLSVRLTSPAQRLTHQRERLTGLARRVSSTCRAVLAHDHTRLTLLRQRLHHARPDVQQATTRLAAARLTLVRSQRHALVAWQRQLQHHAERLRALDPHLTLARGYAIVRDDAGTIVGDAAQLCTGQGLDVQFARGQRRVIVAATATQATGQLF